MTRPRRKTLLVFSQTFVPDPASVGQHMADVCVEMARRGYSVRVYAANRGYEDPSQVYARREDLRGVDVRRLAFSSFGKKSISSRVLGTATFLIQCVFLALFTPNIDGIFFSTSPPLIGAAAVLARVFRRIPIFYWAMDLNPDQLISMGKLKAGSPIAKLLEGVNRTILRQSSVVVALDRFMADRLRRRAPLEGKLLVMPPWPHDENLEAPPAASDNPFRKAHGLGGTFVVMYSGNHSPANPLTTLLEAAKPFADDPAIRFLFVGGGSGKREVEEFIRTTRQANVISLPYQPMSELRHSLSAADVHVVSLGEGMVGIVHPCKIYGAMAVARPILFLGPRPSHISDLLDKHPIGRHVSHGDVAGAVAAIRELRDAGAAERERMGTIAAEVLHRSLSQRILCGRFCDRLDEELSRPPRL
jgi:colanic acid biosynthesis glycosyl transferase WcaI